MDATDQGFLAQLFSKRAEDGFDVKLDDVAFSLWASERKLPATTKRADRAKSIDSLGVLHHVNQGLKAFGDDCDLHDTQRDEALERRADHIIAKFYLEKRELEDRKDVYDKSYVVQVWGVKPHHHEVCRASFLM